MLNFFYVDKQYIEYLKRWESKIPNIDYDSHKKFVCGALIQLAGMAYYAPVSHYKKPNASTFLIYDGDKAISSIRLNFMFPVLRDTIQKVDFHRLQHEDPRYASLVRKELAYCRDHVDALQRQAQKVYRRGSNPQDFLFQFCCDFQLLQTKAEEYQNKWLQG